MTETEPPAEGSFWTSDAFTGDPDRDLGIDTWLLMYGTQRWVNRRVESVEWINAEQTLRKVSVDFDLPLYAPSGNRKEWLVPLAVLRKSPLQRFNLHDESGTVLPVLTRHQNSFVAWSVLVALAEEVADDESEPIPIDADLSAHLKAVADASADRAPVELSRLWKRGAAESRHFRRILKADSAFRDTAETLARNFLLLVPVVHAKGARRIIKFSYVQDVGLPARNLTMQTGFEDIPYAVEVPAVDEGASYHISFKVPAGVRISQARLIDSRGNEIADHIALADHAHLYPTDVPTGEHADAEILVRPVGPGLIRTSAVFAGLNAALLTCLFLRIRHVPLGTGTSVLLTVPGLVSLLILRPDEHPMASRLLLGFRAVVAFAGSLPFLMAVCLATKISLPLRYTLWAEFTALGWIAFFVVGGAYISYVVSSRTLRKKVADA